MIMLLFACVAVCCHTIMIVLAPWLAPKGTICLQYVGNEADCRYNINKETCNIKRSIIFQILSDLKSGSVWPL